ncbi:MAG: D-aminoacyl-tRNA deacylase [Synergistales bacterium]|nr:D-tyrosyl-tRNA(Tyr) deacylase [Bacteroidales bacterium]MDY6434731.1 D-aminoacyl-tRNA deacylase [Synergistales bacterium]MDY6381331.1 D-aminoacyl-tRNA deacylase [Bacteroidales bacterium]MDY6393662.1 D-aminoacyl-tRNA deacylase [Bacteroidales bacterium]MDY6395665.1 D-aminoacyl-tRNA deacylase [Bacteroidales bacterium]
MRVVIQRVTKAKVSIENKEKSSIGKGMMILMAVEDSDTEQDIEWLTDKIVKLRIFDDENGVMNKSVLDVDQQIMVVSQFTLFASTKKGNRPSYLRSSKPEFSKPMYEKFVLSLQGKLGKPVATGEFGTFMQIDLCNDGPTTIIIDSKLKE